MATLLGMSIYVSFLAFCFFGALLYACGWLLLKLRGLRALKDPTSVPIGAFVGTISTAWALSLGFVAADAWTLNSRADLATSNERSAIFRMLGTAHPTVLNNERLKNAVETYRNLVVSDEWGADDNIVPSPKVEKSLLAIRSVVQTVASDGTPSPIVSQLIHDFNELQNARNDRIAIANTSIDQYKWYLVLALTFLTIATIASTHADRVRAGRHALLLYSATASISLWILAIHANPYIGTEELNSTLLFSSQRS